ncbi:MAG: MmcQ/YjbR family DNA-binding protein [Bacteroidota bacterium]
MNIEEFREYCLGKKGVTESMPFGEETLVFKVLDKMFALTVLDKDFSFNVKCDPEFAVELREKYPSVQPGYHMNKKCWNTIYVDGNVSDDILCKWIDHSYMKVVIKMTKKQKDTLASIKP